MYRIENTLLPTYSAKLAWQLVSHWRAVKKPRHEDVYLLILVYWQAVEPQKFLPFLFY